MEQRGPDRSGRLFLAFLLAGLGLIACGDVAAPPSTDFVDEPVTVSVPPLSVPAGKVAVGRGDIAPVFSGVLLSGERMTSTSLDGRPIVLNFWLTSCEPCIREMPALAATMRSHEDEGLLVIGVNYGETADVIQEFVDGFDTGLDFPILLDDTGDVTTSYGVAALPTTYFIDRSGFIRYRRIGELGDEHISVGLSRITG